MLGFTDLIALMFVLGVLITIHEWGHFYAARKSGVGVEVFSIGFGPTIFSTTRGMTKYQIALIPFGGYVKMVGEDDFEEVKDAAKKVKDAVKDGDDSEQEEVERKVVDPELSFQNKSIGKRSIIVAAGAVMNLILAMVLYPMMYMFGVEEPKYLSQAPVVGFVVPDEAGERAGLLEGDVVVSVNGIEMKDWKALQESLLLNPGKTLNLKVNRQGSSLPLTIIPTESKELGIGIAGFLPPIMPEISGLSTDDPAYSAGLLPGDMVKSINGTKIRSWHQMATFIRNADGELEFVIEREGLLRNYPITPVLSEASGYKIIGITQPEGDTHVVTYSFVESIGKGWAKAKSDATLLFVVLNKLIRGELSTKALGGPVLIAKVSGDAAEQGIGNLIYIMAMLSLQLGIINLLPIPVLDGGHLMFYGIEALRGGKPVHEKIMHYSQLVFMVLLLGFMVYITIIDIQRFFF